MTQAGNTLPGGAPGTCAVLALVVGGVLPEGDAAPRLRCRREGGGYDGADPVAGRLVAVGHGVELEFALPAGPVDFILVEPAALPGSYRIARLAWDGEAVPDLPRRVIAAEERADVDAVEEGALRVTSEHGRPWVEIDVRGLAGRAAGTRIGLLLQRDPDGTAAAAGIAKLGGGLSAELAFVQSGIARLGREAGAMSDRIGEGLLAIAGDQARLEGRMQALEASGDAHSGTLERRLSALEAVLDGRAAEQSLAALAALVERKAAERAAADAAAAREIESIRHALDRLQAQVDRVTNSVENVFWRRWLRRLRGGGR